MKDRCKPACVIEGRTNRTNYQTDVSLSHDALPLDSGSPARDLDYECVGITASADDLHSIIPP